MSELLYYFLHLFAGIICFWCTYYQSEDISNRVRSTSSVPEPLFILFALNIASGFTLSAYSAIGLLLTVTRLLEGQA